MTNTGGNAIAQGFYRSDVDNAEIWVSSDDGCAVITRDASGKMTYTLVSPSKYLAALIAIDTSNFCFLDRVQTIALIKEARGTAAGGLVTAPAASTSKPSVVAKPTGIGSSLAGFNATAELVVGKILGLRTWKIDYDGMLTGVSFELVHKPGLNIGVCGHRGDGRIRSNHDMTNCTCGFHAYFAGETLGFRGDVTGIIAGTGQTVVGSKGFRSANSEIVALAVEGSRQEFNTKVEVVEDAVPPRKPNALKRALGRVLPAGQMFSAGGVFPGVAYAYFGIMSTVWFLVGLLSGMPGGVLIGTAVSALLCTLVLGTDRATWRRERKIPVPPAGARQTDRTEVARKLAQKYPDVPIYTSVGAMLKKHPVSTSKEFYS